MSPANLAPSILSANISSTLAILLPTDLFSPKYSTTLKITYLKTMTMKRFIVSELKFWL